MRKTFTVKATVTAVAAIAFGGLLASCGSSSKSSSTKTKDTSATTTSQPAQKPAAAALVTAKKDAKLGTVLADDKGMTLYTLTKNGKPVVCSGPCLSAWPPLIVPNGSSAPTGSTGISGLSTVMGPDGIHLAAVKGLPLYHFVKDKDAEDAYGEGLATFGGVWHVSKTTAAPSAPAGKESSGASTTTTAPTTSSGY